MKVQPLTLQEATIGGFNYTATITHEDLTQTTANTAQTINIVNPLVAGSTIEAVAWELVTPFENTADTAFNTTTMSVGDSAAVTTHISATELNLNGTEVFRGRTNTAKSYTSADKLTVTFNSMTGKSLSNINKGELVVFFRLSLPAGLKNP